MATSEASDAMTEGGPPSNNELVQMLESLGGAGSGGEFGAFLKSLGADGEGLLRDCDLGHDLLIRALENRLAGVGEPQHTIVFKTNHSDKWWTKDRRYWMAAPSPLKLADADEETATRSLCARQQRLRDKLVADLTQGGRIFVFRHALRNLNEAEVERLHAAITSFGPSTLLYVRSADECHPAGTVKLVRPGLLVGAMARFIVSPDNQYLGPVHDAWHALCSAALRVYMSPSPAEPGTAKAAAPPAVAVPAEPSPAGAAAIAGPSTGATAATPPAAHTSSRPPPCTPEPAETSALDRAGIATSPGLDPTASASQAVPEVPADGETPPIARPAILATPAGARPPRLIVAVGNCQVAAMAGLFRKFSAARTGDRIEAIASYQDLSAEALDMIGQADVLIEQILDVAPKADVVGIPATAQRLYIPSVSASFLWPFAGQAHPRNFVPSFMTVGPYGGEAGDSMLNRFIAAGTDPEQAVETYMALDARARINLDRLFELVMDRQRSRDATAGYRTADTIESYFRTEQIFLSPFHPNLRVALSLATQFFQQLGASQDDIDRLHRYTRVAPFPRDELPIHPSVAKHFDLTWALPDKRYRFMNEGSFTAREYALRYIHFTWNEPLEEGLALIRSGTTEAAEEKLKAGLALSPQSASAHASLARLYATRPADRGAAYAAIRRAVELEPDSAAYLGMLGNFLREDGVADEAEPMLRRALAAAPEDSYYYLILAILLRQIGRHREACDLMQQATEIEPYIAQLRAQRAEFLEAAGELEAAIEQLDAAMRLESGNSTWLQRRLGLLTRLGRLDDAIEAARQSVATAPHDVRTRVVLSQLLCRANRVTEGLMEAYNAAIHQPPHADAFAQLGAALRQNNDFDPAERAFLRAIELAPEVAHFHHELSVIHAQRKNWGAAVAAASEAIAREPSNPARLMHIAGLLAARGDHAGAASAIRKAVDMSPDNATYRIALGRALVEQGKAAEALLGFQIYALAHAEDTQVLAHLAYLQEQNGDAAAAERTVRQALERDPGNTALHRQLEALTARREPASAAAYRVIV